MVSSDRQPQSTLTSPLVARQYTLGQVVQCRGVGLHSGQTTTVTLKPAAPGRGRYFVRTDLPGHPEIPATVAAVGETVLSTELCRGEASVRTVEHLLAALAGLGIDNARLEVDGPEIPLLDGSARAWVEAITAADWVAQGADRPQVELPQPFTVHDGDAFVAAFPAQDCRLTYGIDFDVEAIGNQWFSWSPGVDPEGAQGFAAAVAPARTFGLAHQIDSLRAQGLIRGGSLDNALVCGQEGWLNPPLRFDNEPVRHKMLDLIGDLSLLGPLPRAHVVAYKASHRLHLDLARRVASEVGVAAGIPTGAEGEGGSAGIQR
mgnify:CR=1 FL=1